MSLNFDVPCGVKINKKSVVFMGLRHFETTRGFSVMGSRSALVMV